MSALFHEKLKKSPLKWVYFEKIIKPLQFFWPALTTYNVKDKPLRHVKKAWQFISKQFIIIIMSVLFHEKLKNSPIKWVDFEK